MSEEQFYTIKNSVLHHIQELFEEMEEGLVMQHQEKYTLLEDSFESANEVGELRVAFEQWYRDHAEDIDLESTADELWSNALASAEDGISADFDEEDQYM
ncbi:MAG: hypothetical protein COU33_03815 [Candidatus Magasanikbacteria bacterium CG10_big_fil_rev_8_21_14_0_10_43_6]|uniref:Uncharacterized protein n=1 Tax=Candidatus Magasanikbacteria bacterium CG10_big_fil_rev_8_21_14_0_10_43_6 TaxID=1974650 RepID=A0A2M6W0J4_9BACT|nr:MAG: hypothetical protein COU33_03815 [Candidatus Magasanikbacteria bacterium CG10_big_fil_rev_8_21_14_0_10_43_6]